MRKIAAGAVDGRGGWFETRLLVAAVSVAGLVATPAVAQFQTGDVFAAQSGIVKRYDSAGNLLGTLTTTVGGFTTGMAFDSASNLLATNFSDNSVSRFDINGTLLEARFVSGFNAAPESISFNSAGEFYVGQADGGRDIRKFDAAGNLLDAFDVATEDRGSDWIQLAGDGCTMYYTSEGSKVLRYNVCTDTQMADFATGLQRPCYALRLIPGGALVACAPLIYRLDSSGNVVNTYDAAGEDAWFAMNIDPDGTSFWSANINNGQIYRFDIATGAVIIDFSSGGGTFGLAVFGEPLPPAVAAPVPSMSLAAMAVLGSFMAAGGGWLLGRRRS
ncbi:hypothetical protein L6Q96_17990 [Candidatus Binatia bacterium]|nr:hypothetical protein [Candidatus Binatia bacterium]